MATIRELSVVIQVTTQDKEGREHYREHRVTMSEVDESVKDFADRVAIVIEYAHHRGAP